MKKILLTIFLIQSFSACSPYIDTYVRQLQYPNADMRVYAAQKLGESKTPDAVPHLIKALRDEKVRVRLAAIDALGQLQDKQATSSLIPFLTDKRVRVVFASIEALGAIGDSTAVDALSELVTAELPTIRLAAIDALGLIGSTQAWDVLEAQVWHESSDVRGITALALGRIAHPQAVPALIRLLADPSDHVHNMALYALNKIDANWRQHDRINWMLWAFCTDLMVDDIVGNEHALIRYGILRGMNTIDPNWHDREWAPELIQHYEMRLREADLPTRRVAARVLGELGDVRAVDILINSLQTRDRRLRNNAILALGNLGDQRAIPILQNILNGQDLRIKHAAILALASLNDTTVVPLMIAQLTPETLALRSGQPGWDIPLGVAAALGNLRSSKKMDVLISLLNHKQGRVRQQAVRSLGKIGDQRAAGAVSKLLQDASSQVRNAAVRTLATLGTKKVVDDLIVLLGTGKASDKRVVSTLDQLDSDWRDRDLFDRQMDFILSRFKTSDMTVQREVVSALAYVRGSKADEVLMDILKRRKLLLVAKAYPYYIQHARKQAVSALLQTLDVYGSEKMVQTYLASGHPKLTQAARAWAHSHGMALVTWPEVASETGVGG